MPHRRPIRLTLHPCSRFSLASSGPDMGAHMIENTTSMTLNHPPAQVFDFLADFENEPAWNPECISVEKTSPGPASAGTTYVGRMRKIGTVQMTLESHEPHRR